MKTGFITLSLLIGSCLFGACTYVKLGMATPCVLALGMSQCSVVVEAWGGQISNRRGHSGLVMELGVGRGVPAGMTDADSAHEPSAS